MLLYVRSVKPLNSSLSLATLALRSPSVTLKLLLVFGLASTVNAANRVDIKLSIGASAQQSNDVQIPNDSNGTRFSLNDIAGSGPWPAARLEGIWNFAERHAMRLLLAPLSYSETGTVDQSIRFAGETFDANQPVQAEYRFNSWRIGYRYHLRADDKLNLWVGGTLKVRDAEIKLTQGAVSSLDDDVGFVPLLYLAAEYRLGERWSLEADIDALGGGPGRAIDLGVGLNYSLNNAFHVGLEYRALEGGADIDELYNFAWFNSALLTFSYVR